MKSILIMLCVLLCCATASSQSVYKDRLVHTYSIVAIDEQTGEIGAAVQSHWFSVGSLVLWGEAGVGAVATQSFVNPAFGPQGLALMRGGATPREALDIMLRGDDGRAVRQVALIDAAGNTAAHTGASCIPAAGHISKKGYSVQANLMHNERVWPAMEKAFLETGGSLAARLVAALEAAQAQGGDIRGQQSAAILVVRGTATGNLWEDRLVDLRVEDHPEPVAEIRRLLKVHQAYGHMNAGDLAVEHGDEAGALREYGSAQRMMPDNLEMKYWTAVSLANMKRIDDALPMFYEVFLSDENWKTLTPRLVPLKLLNVDEATLKKIMK